MLDSDLQVRSSWHTLVRMLAGMAATLSAELVKATLHVGGTIYLQRVNLHSERHCSAKITSQKAC